MARTQGTTARVQRLTSLVAVVLVGVAVGFAFGRVFVGRESTYQMVAAGVASGVIAWAFERRSLLLATVASLGLLFVAVGLIVLPETLWNGLPTLDTLAAMGTAAGAVGEEARARVSPAEPGAPLLFASVTAVWAAVFSCHALAIRAGSPLLALLPPLALIGFADSVLDDLVKPAYGVLFLIAALAIAFADSIRRVQGWGPVWSGSGRRSHFLAATGRSARRIGLATVALAVAAPFLLPGFGSRAVIDISSSGDRDGVSVSPLVSMASSLTNGDPQDVFVVESDRPTYWRMTALEIFDGIHWQIDETDPEPVVQGTTLGSATGDGSATTTVTVVNRLEDFDWLPVPSDAAGFSIDSDVSWSPDSGTVTVAGGLQEGDVYEVRSTFSEPTKEQLASEESYPSPLPELLALPDDVRGELRQKAEEWTAGSTNVYEQVVAIQDHLALSGEFRYDELVSPGEDSAALMDFLEVNKRGFCQQFATAMAALLRSLNIPARVAVGFTTGSTISTEETTPAGSATEAGSEPPSAADAGEATSAPPAAEEYAVTTDQLHAWVEVQFPTSGWVAFEPTPRRSGGSWTRPNTVPPDEGNPCDLRNPRVFLQEGCGGSSSTGTSSSSVTSSSPAVRFPDPDRPQTGLTEANGPPTRLIVAGIVLLLFLLAVAAVPAARAVRRRRLLRRAAGDPRRLILATYDVMLERAAELGLAREPGETPVEYLTKVTTSGRLENGHLHRLTETTVRAAYAPDEPTADDALDATGDANEVIDELRRSSTVRDRIVGPFLRRLR
ncbi:MAG: transglutaminase TgpA family protein [Actinomycetota bacterium]